ncbi:hypothetical protein FZC76_18650 [Sutcliffiella horikoshii]|uniref:Uncharacterized protein n=1 Tax=Sutcliffiella horikoshii TaxID=79883 RepID=A0A5D4SMT5_9BACI|nr:hypothetical protein FZC76_18650 [Sutcliffiella horikoshii]
MIGAIGEDSSKMLRIFFVRCFAVEAFLVLREMAFRGDPGRRFSEEAPQTPLGKRSLVRTSTAVFNRAFILNEVERGRDDLTYQD